ncbi:hypothetical protein BUE80_DR006973 [Diplocarpon rosae]|nr:hypothetical protein BUE80_DR006973 [Diplocarpon rosae]
MRSTYFSIALLYSLATGAFAACKQSKPACNSEVGCTNDAKNFSCPAGSTLDGNCVVQYFPATPDESVVAAKTSMLMELDSSTFDLDLRAGLWSLRGFGLL